MPSPATNRASGRGGNATASNSSSKASAKKPLDIGKPLGVHDTNSVRAKVRKWQQEGGGVVVANDVVYYEEDEENASAVETSLGISTPPRGRASHSSKARSSSTPRKRVISDEHWKLNRNAARGTGGTSQPKVPSSPNKRVAEYTSNDPIETPRREKKDDGKDDRPRPSPISRSRERNRVGAPPETLRGHRKSKSTSRDLDMKFSEHHDSSRHERAQSRSRARAASKSTPDLKPVNTERRRPKSMPPEGDAERADRVRNSVQAPEAANNTANKTHTPLKAPPKGGIFTHMLGESKKIFARPEPPRPKGSRIEAWLSDTPDSFAREAESARDAESVHGTESVQSDVEIPAPLKMRASRARRTSRLEETRDRATDSELSLEERPRPRSTAHRRSRTRDELLPEGEKSKDRPSGLGRDRDRDRYRDRDRARDRDTTPSPSGRRPKPRRRSKSPSHAESEPSEKPHEEENAEAGETESHVYSEGSEVSGGNPPIPLGRKRAFPSTGGKRLPTIASMESITTHEPTKPQESQEPQESRELKEPEPPQESPQEPPQEPQKEPKPAEPTEKAPAKKEKPAPAKEEPPEAEERDQFDPNSLPLVTNQLRRRLTTHDDLISVLSTNTRSRSLKSARSLRVNKGSATTATVNDLLRELAADETKYMRELKTLVGGVIPVLLTCVLSGSDSAAAAGLFRPSADPQDEANFTKPIVDMGVAIERLKTLHKRIPQDHADALLTWSAGAQRVYRDYLKAWRLGFKDVIVNLAPLDEQEAAKDAAESGIENDNSDRKSLDEGMARDENGDIVDGEGEKVDVAYLLKRPLVRLKYLSKTFKGISIVQPSPKADEVASSYQALVTEARRRAREERARLEDEAASSIDATRARDPATLGALPGVTIDKTRRVRARDFFGLTLYHSSGQVVDCRVELLMRDNAPVHGGGGDLLICEVDHSDRWLLFPPIDFGCVSAKTGDVKGDLIVMIRSVPGHIRAWQEVMLLHIDEEEVAFEWVQLLGLQPVPPSISRNQSFVDRARQRQQQLLPPPEKKPEEQEQDGLQDDNPGNALALVQVPPPSPSHLDVPIGEKATSRAARLSLTPKEDPSTAESSAGESRASTAITRESDYADRIATASPQPLILHARDPRTTTPADSPGLKRSKAKRMSRYGESPSPSPGPSPKKESASEKKTCPSTPQKEHHSDKRGVLSPTPARDPNFNEQKQFALPKTPTRDADDSRPSSRLSSVPSVDLPSIPKLRSGSSYTRLSEPLDLEPDEDDDDNISLDPSELPESPSRRKSDDSSEHGDGDEPPPPPPHRSPSSTLSGPVLNPSAPANRRRGSSPLKHEYEPSMESEESYSDSDTSTVRRYDMDSASEYSVSDSSEDESEDELASSVQPTETPEWAKVTERASIVPSGSSLTPSHSASQGGYRSVPSQPTKSSRVMAGLFAWSNRGSWESLLSDECLLIVSPGLIEAYEMSVAPPESDEGSGKPNKGRPMVALELTPLVPIRRGTAIDISIRSPPTERSKITWSNNIMFRSRTPEECETLYGLINGSRINNPTYIALQNARGPYAEQRLPLESSNKSAGGMFGWPRRRKSYRASPASPRSLAEHSESSVGTMSSAFSALKRFGNGSKMFSISRSTVTSRSGQPEEGSMHSADTGAHSAGSGIGRIAAAIKGVDGIGLSNAKIRLYMRETQTKWRDMGAARLTIMPATEGADKNGSGPPQSSASSSATQRAVDSHEPRKRILIHGKTRNEVLLDVALGESSFERVARTGIAVSVWEEKSATAKDSFFGGGGSGSGNGNNCGGGGMPERGGVTGGTYRIYMVQMKSEAEAAYTFGLVGKLKY